MWVGEPPHIRLIAPGRAGRYGLFARGQNIKNSGRFEGLGVRLWVVDVGLSQCRGIPYGFRIEVAACYRRF